MDAISSLSLKVDNFGKKHANLEQLLFEDDDVRTAVLAMRQSDNIRHLADVSKFLQFSMMKNQKRPYFVACPAINCILQLNLHFVASAHSKLNESLILQAMVHLALGFS